MSEIETMIFADNGFPLEDRLGKVKETLEPIFEDIKQRYLEEYYGAIEKGAKKVTLKVISPYTMKCQIYKALSQFKTIENNVANEATAEQIMQIFQVLADYSLGEEDQVRRMMGKRKVDEMERQKGKFIECSARHGMSAKDAEALFNQILNFASYCFNRSLSAAYAFVAYHTAYLKCHYPVEYLSALLSSVADDQEKTQLYIEVALKNGIKVMPPDINKSNAEFTPDGDFIRFGLASIKQVGEVVVTQEP